MNAICQPRPLRVALYSHDSLGLGHVRRNLALAHSFSKRIPELTGQPVTGLLLTGFDSISEQLPSGFDHVSLPAIAKDAGSYLPRRLNVTMSRLIRLRSRLLASSLMAFEPDLVIVDRHPLGFRGEIEWALRCLREERPQVAIVLGLREVLDSPEAAQAEWEKTDLETVCELFDAIWLYGDPRIHDAVASGEIPGRLAGLVTHTGYLANDRPKLLSPDNGKPYVLTMVGGGMDGAALCRVAVQANVPSGYDHLVVTGPEMSEAERREIAESSLPGTKVLATVPDGLAAIRSADALISMAGYNTVAEALSTDIAHLLVPRFKPRKEQLIRARALANVGLADLLEYAQLTPQTISDWLSGAVRRKVDRRELALNGLENTVHLAIGLIKTNRLEVVA